MMARYIPYDLIKMLNKYAIKEGEGPCGPACLSVIEQRSITHILKVWQRLFCEYPGWARWKELKQYLEYKGYEVKYKRFQGEINPTKDKYIICRVQWKGAGDENNFYGWNHWSAATMHTHFILVDDCWVFCSESGWFSLSALNDYLDENNGLVTSFMEIHNPNTNANRLAEPVVRRASESVTC